MRPNPDLQLIKKARGDKAAFRIIVEQTQHLVYSVAYRFLGNMHDAEDTVQEVYIKLWHNLGRYDGRSRLTTWLYRITANHCLDKLRSRKPALDEIAPDLEDAEPLIIDKMDQQELLERIQWAASQLTPKQQAAFILRDLEGLDVGETCEILEITEGQLKSNLYHARKQMQELLKHERNKYGM